MPCQTFAGHAPLKERQIVFNAIIDSKRIAVLTGAGISCSAGLPDFRSKEGLYNLLYAKSGSESESTTDERPAKRSKGSPSAIKGQELFSANVFRDAATASLFFKFIASLYELCIADDTHATPTHHFISKLAKKGKLLRCYTQNIDCLEDQVGLKAVLLAQERSATSTNSKEASGKKWEGDVVQLHGRIDRVKCGCGYTGDWTDDILEAMSDGLAPECPGCEERADQRRTQRKRSIKQVGHMGVLKPAVTLYDDAPTSEEVEIANITDYDLKRKCDLVLVMGTSLKVPGFKALVKDFIFEAKKKNKKISAVLVNATNVLSSEWNSIFDCFILQDCDEFVTQLTAHWKKRRPEDFIQQVALSNVSNSSKAFKSVAGNAFKSKIVTATLMPAVEISSQLTRSPRRNLSRQDSSIIYLGSSSADSIRSSPSSPRSDQSSSSSGNRLGLGSKSQHRQDHDIPQS